MDLPEIEHRKLHEIINAEFKLKGLPPPNATGVDNWRSRLRRGQITSLELDRAKDALRSSAKHFDSEFPNRFNLVDKMNQRLLEYADELPETLRRARNARRRR